MLNGLYGITDITLTPYTDIFVQVELALKGGMKILQLRDKENKNERLLDMCQELKALVHHYDAKFIINDRVQLCKNINADGVHIGRNDKNYQEVREFLGKDYIIGISCYDDLEKAKYHEDMGVDYVAFGSFYTSPTKPHAKVVSKDILNKADEELKIPVCAIGGITLENAPDLINRGADMIAVISDLWKNEDIMKHASDYSALMS